MTPMPRTTLRIPIPEHVEEALCTLAWLEDRDPKRQAERLIREGLIRAGALQADDREPVGATLTASPILGEQS
jgi:hypothetical protein